jgi:hypothetical protein
MMAAMFTRSSSCRSWFRRVGRALVLVTQLVALVAPLAEAHEERPLSAHVEAPRTVPHPGHHAGECPACVLLSVHGCPATRAQLELCERERVVVPRLSSVRADRSARGISNSSRAPPSAL